MILDKLKDKRIFKIESREYYAKKNKVPLSTVGDFVVTEKCDGYFSVTLSKKELLQLSEELRLLAMGPTKTSGDIFDTDIWGR